MEKEWVRENGKIFTVCIFLYFQKNISANYRQVEDIVSHVRGFTQTLYFLPFSRRRNRFICLDKESGNIKEVGAHGTGIATNRQTTVI